MAATAEKSGSTIETTGEKTTAPRPPCNIVLLSDGTGNSAAAVHKTNVWRLYQALDIGDAGVPQQIAFYDDGVGTSGLGPIKYLGLALGVGLARNVKDLYTALCRNYREGDAIYLFGFSRGAFTVRVLAGLIMRCGLVTAPSDAELTQRVKLAYAEYKRDVARRATATRPWLIAGQRLGGHAVGKRAKCIRLGPDGADVFQYFPRIRFVGVWDTVDAYGMPVDELKTAIDQVVWPMTLADRALSDGVDRACQALSLDDERPTFRPVLWDERSAPAERITQVWFPGVHANVGGGYPDDGLAHVALHWMMEEAKQAGLRFREQDTDAIRDCANADGKQYDSRAGLAGYYRYGPRSVDALCKDDAHGVAVVRPMIHVSAQHRIQTRHVAYAPVSYPLEDYRVVEVRPDVDAANEADAERQKPVLIDVPLIETEPQRNGRRDDDALVRDAVWWRKAAYYATVALTLLLAAFPLLADRGWVPDLPTVWPTGAAWLSLLLGKILDLAAYVVPNVVATTWFSSFVAHPASFLIVAGLLALLFFRESDRLQAVVFDRAEYAHRRVSWQIDLAAKHAPKDIKAPKPGLADRFARGLRESGVGKALAEAGVGLAMLVALLLVVPVGLVVGFLYLPTFARNRARRMRYGVRPDPVAPERIRPKAPAGGMLPAGNPPAMPPEPPRPVPRAARR